MKKIVLCVPNFSEGKNKEVIDQIADAIGNTENITLLGFDTGASTNRTVYTFVGPPDAVVEAALNGARIAKKLIDMAKHKGQHPRMGALDVCPFIPVQGVEIEECIYCAKKFSEKLAAEFKVPVYLYGFASTQEYRKTLPQIRAGEYEGLAEKLSHPQWRPDYGPTLFVPKWGATVVGARKALIAYNINLLSTKEQAHRIALNIRQHGRGADNPGRLKHVQAIGWWLEEYNLAQVSANLLDHDETPLHVVYEEVCKDAQELKVAVTGSQIVGVVPLKAILQVADYYIKKEQLFILEDAQKIQLAINRLGLNALETFKPAERIIEYMLPSEEDKLLVKTCVSSFIHLVASRTPTPGGGSVAATVGAMGAGLSTMVGLLMYGRKQWEHLDYKIRKVIPILHRTVKELIPLIDADTHAFTDYMEASKLPTSTPDEVKARDDAMQAGLMRAINVPMNLARTINSLWDAVVELAEICNVNTKSDLQVSARCLETGVWGAYYNVMINAESITDETYRTKIINEVQMEVKKAQDFCKIVLEILASRKKRSPSKTTSSTSTKSSLTSQSSSRSVISQPSSRSVISARKGV